MSITIPAPLERSHNPGLEQHLGICYPVLDKGFVQLVDYMGNESLIVKAARTSYGEGTRQVSDDAALIRYLMRHKHTTPFEKPHLEFLVHIPMDAWRQGVRHRTASINEYSTRYSVAIDDRQETSPSEWRSQSKDNKQGSGDFLDIEVGTFLSDRERELHAMALEVYNERLEQGVAREQARKDLPLSTYTLVSWTWDLHNLLHFLSLRLDKHAQLEIRAYAEAIAEIIADGFPNVWRAFNDFDMRRGALLLTACDIVALKTHTAGGCVEPNMFPTKREFDEFNEKLGRLL